MPFSAKNRAATGRALVALRASKDRLWPDNDHELFLKGLQRIEFVDRRKTGDEDSSELVPGTQEFADRMAKAGLAIASLLVQMRRRREANFSGGVARDAVSARKGLRSELYAQGDDVRPEGNIDVAFDKVLIRKALQLALLSVHEIGGTYTDFLRTQIDFALELDKRLVFWITREQETSLIRKSRD